MALRRIRFFVTYKNFFKLKTVQKLMKNETQLVETILLQYNSSYVASLPDHRHQFLLRFGLREHH